MAVKGYQAKLEYNPTVGNLNLTTGWLPDAATPLEVRSIKPPKVAAQDIDTTHLNSADEFEESEPGLANGGDLEMVLRYDKTQTATLYALHRLARMFRVRYADNSGWKFN